MKSSVLRILLVLLLLPDGAFAANSVVNMSHYDLMRPDFVGMASEGIVGVIHEATFPRLERDARYYERQRAALEAGLLWGAYHFGDATNPIGQADHFLNAVAAARPPIRPDDPEKRRAGVLLVLDFEKNGHYPGGTMSVAQAVAFVERIKERTGKYPGPVSAVNIGCGKCSTAQAPPQHTAKHWQIAGCGLLTIMPSLGTRHPGAPGICGNTVAMVNAICDLGACFRNR